MIERNPVKIPQQLLFNKILLKLVWTIVSQLEFNCDIKIITLYCCFIFIFAGNYIYHKTAVDDFTEAIIRTPWFRNENQQYCIKFSLHMYGNSNKTYEGDNPPFFPWSSRRETERSYGGALRVYAYEKLVGQEIGNHRFLFGKLRNQGNRWHTFTTSYSQNSSVEVSYSF